MQNNILVESRQARSEVSTRLFFYKKVEFLNFLLKNLGFLVVISYKPLSYRKISLYLLNAPKNTSVFPTEYNRLLLQSQDVRMDFTTVPLLRKNISRDGLARVPEYGRSNSLDLVPGHVAGHNRRTRCVGNRQGEVYLRSNSFTNDRSSPVRHAANNNNKNNNNNNNNNNSNNNNRYVNRFTMADVRYSPVPHHLDSDDSTQDTVPPAPPSVTGPARYPSIFAGDSGGGSVYSNPNFKPARTRRSSIPRLRRPVGGK